VPGARMNDLKDVSVEITKRGPEEQKQRGHRQTRPVTERHGLELCFCPSSLAISDSSWVTTPA
jgi:hypothetical protein